VNDKVELIPCLLLFVTYMLEPAVKSNNSQKSLPDFSSKNSIIAAGMIPLVPPPSIES